jgi:hypothetical protein
MTKHIPLILVLMLCGCERAMEDKNCIIIENRPYIFGYRILVGEDKKVCGIQNIPQLASLIRGELHDTSSSTK